jgi:alkanesulfonate monooxygenase
MRKNGIGVCLRACIVCRPTREEAITVAESLLPEDDQESTVKLKDDSQMYREGKRALQHEQWLSNTIWTGLVPHYGPVWTTLIGSPQELAAAFLEYKRIGITEFIISGWPEVDEMTNFGRNVLPLIREGEQKIQEARSAAKS